MIIMLYFILCTLYSIAALCMGMQFALYIVCIFLSLTVTLYCLVIGLSCLEIVTRMYEIIVII